MTAPTDSYPIDLQPPAPPAIRWPLHPPPYRLELLNEWIARLAQDYGVTATLFCRHVLSVTPPLPDTIPDHAQRTLAMGAGIELDCVRRMTLAGMMREVMAEVERTCKTNPQAVHAFTRKLRPAAPQA
ncbi:MAG: TniQ family protein [Planctomycetia bacterium]|nr:MAG: TniQ family protein [Planctomycetia bacterium]